MTAGMSTVHGALVRPSLTGTERQDKPCRDFVAQRAYGDDQTLLGIVDRVEKGLLDAIR